MSQLRCECGDSECPSCGTAQGTREEVSLYWRTQYGSLCERQAGPDADGWLTVRRLDDGAIRTFNAHQMYAVPLQEALREAEAILRGEKR
jgi:hypothetical protein